MIKFIMANTANKRKPFYIKASSVANCYFIRIIITWSTECLMKNLMK